MTLAQLQTAAQTVLGHELAFSAEQFRRSIDAQHFMDIRRGLGGVAPDATAAVLEKCAEQLTADVGAFANTTARLAEADSARGMFCRSGTRMPSTASVSQNDKTG